MQDFFLSPKFRKALIAAILAALGVYGYSFTSGCTPAQLSKADSAFDAADAAHAELNCVRGALKRYDVLTHPEATTVEDAAGLAAELTRCASPASDAGAQ